jgi:hypothetical protein
MPLATRKQTWPVLHVNFVGDLDNDLGDLILQHRHFLALGKTAKQQSYIQRFPLRLCCLA